ncbi:MAG TPA: hydroxypyruvate isomerase [Rhodocyclaceae bacterium]|nr:hydroxypyruvate isomerase [Rhodocyclaceae bacterium]
MPRFAANLTFLFTERPFLERFAAARKAGFAAVEFHFPYAFEAATLAETAQAAEIEVALFNLPAGHWDIGERGIACHPKRMAEFQDGVGLAIEYAQQLGCRRLNCLAGRMPPETSSLKARETLIENLRFAAKVAKRAGIALLLEPLNTRDTPGFFVTTARQALELIAAVAADNLHLQYDIYHAQIMSGDLMRTLEENLTHVGHIQIADNPGRHEPGSGEINFFNIFKQLDAIGYSGWIGCEYHPTSTTAASLAWMSQL